MRTLLISAFIMLLSSNSFAQSSFSCREIYQRTASHKLDVRESYDFAIYGESTLYVSGAGFVIHPVFAAITVALIATQIYSGSTPKEQKILEAGNDASGFSRRLLKKLQKKVSANIAMSDIARYIEEGFDSGELCSNFPKLYSKSDVKKMVLEKAAFEFGIQK